MSYSRDLETEADEYAMRTLRLADIPLEAFASGLEKIVDDHEINNEAEWMTYLSTHPEPRERIIKFRHAAE